MIRVRVERDLLGSKSLEIWAAQRPRQSNYLVSIKRTAYFMYILYPAGATLDTSLATGTFQRSGIQSTYMSQSE